MRLYTGLATLLACMFLYLLAAPAQGQVITEGQDSVRVLVPDSIAGEKGFFLAHLKDLDRPEKAALWSAVIPGAGQIYNHSYWKLPLVYGTGVVLGYNLVYNNTRYQSYRIAYNLRHDRDSTTVDEYDNNPEFPYLDSSYGADAEQILKYRRDGYRRNRDLTILLSIGAYALQIAEAYVHAHLKEFDVSDNLSLRVQPNLLRVPAATAAAPPYTPALTLTLYTRP